MSKKERKKIAIFEETQLMYNSFQIFERSNRLLYLSKGNILFLIMILALIINELFHQKIMFLRYLTALTILVYGIYFVTESFRYQYLNGKFIGSLVFNEDNLIINERKIDISEIKKIFIRIDDYLGRNRSYKSTISMSNGTNNLLDLDLKNGEKIKLFFRMDYEHQIDELRPFIISLVKDDIIEIEKGIYLLKLTDDILINRFKIDVTKK